MIPTKISNKNESIKSQIIVIERLDIREKIGEFCKNFYFMTTIIEKNIIKYRYPSHMKKILG